VDSRLMSLTEVAEQLGVPLGTVYAWRTRGLGPRGIRVGKYVRVRQADLDRLAGAAGRPSAGRMNRQQRPADKDGAMRSRLAGQALSADSIPTRSIFAGERSGRAQ